MKRAHLSVPASAPAAPAADLTDRLLDEAKSERPLREAKSVKRKAASRSEERGAKGEEREATSAPIRSSVPSSVDHSVPSVDSIDTALTQSRAAVQSLRLAADDLPARYNLGLRYRLDALAHHLAQIAEFVEQMK